MALRAMPGALLLLLLALLVSQACPEEAPERLCGHRLVRALVRVCGGPRWAPGGEDARLAGSGDREMLRWLEGRHLGPGLLAAEPDAQRRRRRRREGPSNPARLCCQRGCSRAQLLSLCPH